MLVKLALTISKMTPSEGPVDIQKAVMDIYKRLTKLFDGTNGGFGEPPKFPSPSQNLHILSRYAAVNLDSMKWEIKRMVDQALHMGVTTLEGLYNGGIRDVVGGGFSRYSVDRRWQVPHCKPSPLISIVSAHTVATVQSRKCCKSEE